MNDYIKREDAIATILEYSEKPEPGWVTGPYAVAAIRVKNLPAAPVREVVTCGECKHWDSVHNRCRSEDMRAPWAEEGIEMFAEDFCSYGRKRADMRGEEGETT